MPRSFIASLFGFYCPRCRTGKLFYQPWSMETAYKMPETCAHCELRYLPEPGFYYGAMFLSYIVSSFLFLGVALTCVFALKWSVGKTFFWLILAALLTHNFFFRFSRSLWIHLMIKYQG